MLVTERIEIGGPEQFHTAGPQEYSQQRPHRLNHAKQNEQRLPTSGAHQDLAPEIIHQNSGEKPRQRHPRNDNDQRTEDRWKKRLPHRWNLAGQPVDGPFPGAAAQIAHRIAMVTSKWARLENSWTSRSIYSQRIVLILRLVEEKRDQRFAFFSTNADTG